MNRLPAGVPPRASVNLSARDLKLGIGRMNARIKELEAFDPDSVKQQYPCPEIDALEANIDDMLERTFGKGSSDFTRYRQAAHFYRGPMNTMYETQPDVFRKAIADSKSKSLAILGAALRSLEERLKEANESSEEELGANVEFHSKPLSTNVFVVHGHDEGAKLSVANFLERLELVPIILHRMANKGRPIITKLQEEAAEIGFAIVLITPDDHGAKTGEQTKPRARQNVVFELGFFIGLLGPNKVAALMKGGVEVPSDYDGVVYISMDREEWQIPLARELRAAGYKIDLNKLG